MRRLTLIFVLALGALALTTASLHPTPAKAQKPQLIRVKVGASTTLNLGAAPKELSVDDTGIASLSLLDDGQVRITGVAAGNTTLIGTAADGSALIMPIIVEARKVLPAPKSFP